MKSFKVHILAADNTFFDGECESLIIPTSNGQYGILADHANAITAVVPGTAIFRAKGGKNQIAAVSSGLCKIENGEVLLLVDSAERPEEIDEKMAEIAAAEAKEALLQKQSYREYKSTQLLLARNIARMRVKNSGSNL